MKDKREELMAYLAGAIDGDGSFSLMKGQSRKYPYYTPVFQFGNLSEGLLKIFHGAFGGRIYKRKKSQESNRREFFDYSVTNAMCLPLLKQVVDYLQGKKDRALCLIDYIESNPSEGGRKPLGEETLLRRECSYNKMRELNHFNILKLKRSLKKAYENTENDIFWAYLSGLIDTDGFFTINAREGRYFRPMCGIHISDIRCLNYIQENCIIGKTTFAKDKNCKSGFIYRWDIHKIQDFKIILPKIIPYLKLKKQQAKLLLNFIVNKKNCLTCSGKMPEEELQFRIQCKEEIARLNKCDLYKPSLIDSDLLEQENEGQAGSNAVQPDRLSAMASKEDATVRTRDIVQ